MTKTKKRQIRIMTLISIMIFTFLLWNTLNKEELTVLGTSETTPASSSNEIIITKDGIVEFINNYNLYQLVNYAPSMEELTNQNKLVLATNYLLNQENIDFSEGVDAAHYETYIHYVFGVDATIEKEDIKYYSVVIKYDKETDKFISKGNITKPEITNVLDKVTSFSNKQEEYNVNIKSVFMYNKKIYGNITDLFNNKNVLLENIKTTNFEENYYEGIEDKVSEINYNLALEGKHLVLKGYNFVEETE